MKINYKKHITGKEDRDDLVYRAVKSSRGRYSANVWECSAYVAGWISGFRAARRSEKKRKKNPSHSKSRKPL